MSTLRCSACGISWPVDDGLYGKCPLCEGKTDPITNEQPMDAVVALSVKRHADFDRFYEARAKRQLDELDKAAAA